MKRFLAWLHSLFCLPDAPPRPPETAAEFEARIDRQVSLLRALRVVQSDVDRQVWLTVCGDAFTPLQEGVWWAFPPNGVMPVNLQHAIALRIEQDLQGPR
jgi:hypothetical protein